MILQISEQNLVMILADVVVFTGSTHTDQLMVLAGKVFTIHPLGTMSFWAKWRWFDGYHLNVS